MLSKKLGTAETLPSRLLSVIYEFSLFLLLILLAVSLLVGMARLVERYAHWLLKLLSCIYSLGLNVDPTVNSHLGVSQVG